MINGCEIRFFSLKNLLVETSLLKKNKNKDSGIFLKDFAVLTENLVHNVVLLELIRCVTIILRGLEV